MAKIKVKALQIGMTLSADVCDSNGRFLIGQGCVLNEKHLKALNAWGVVSVEISDAELENETDKTKLSPEIMRVIEEQVNALFCHNDMSLPFIKELAMESKLFFIEKLEDQ